MSDYIVLVVVSVGISVCISGAIIGIIKGENDADIIFIKSLLKSFQSSTRNLGDEIDILRARVTDLENKIKEIENHNDR